MHLMNGMLLPLLFIAHDDYKQKSRKYFVFVTGSNRMHTMCNSFGHCAIVMCVQCTLFFDVEKKFSSPLQDI